MSAGQLISDTFLIVKGRFGPLLGLWVIFVAIMIGMSVLFVAVVGATGVAGLSAISAGNFSAASGGGMILASILFYLAYILAAVAQYAALVAMATPLRQASFGESFADGWRSAPALLLLIVVMIIAWIVLAIPLGLVGAALAALGRAGSALMVLLVIGLMLWIGSRLAPLFGVIAVDGVRNPFTAIGRSWRLTTGHALAIFLALLVYLLIVCVIGAVCLLPSLGLLSRMANPVGAASVGSAMGGVGLMFVGFLLFSVIVTISYGALLAVIHGSVSNSAGEGVVEAFA